MISPDVAKDMKGYLAHGIADDPASAEYLYFAAVKEDGGLCGLLCIDPAENESEIKSIGLSPEYCGKGYGSGLLHAAMTELAQIVKETGRDSVKLSASFGMEKPGSERLLWFFEKNGFSQSDICNEYMIRLSTISENVMMKSVERKNTLKGVVSIKDVTDTALNAYSNRLIKAGLYPGISREGLDDTVSVCYMPDGEILGCALFNELSIGVLQNIWINVSLEASNSAVFPLMLAESLRRAKEKFPDNIRVSFLAAEDESERLLNQMFPEEKPCSKAVTCIKDLPAGWKEDRQDTTVFEIISSDNMCCKDCVHNTGMAMECAKYLIKPEAVAAGGMCDYHE